MAGTPGQRHGAVCVWAPGVQPCMAPRRGPSTVRSGRGAGVGTPCLAPFLALPLTGGAAIGRPARPRPPFPPRQGGGSTHRPGLGRLWGAAGVCKSALGPSGCGAGGNAMLCRELCRRCLQSGRVMGPCGEP